MNYEQVTYVEIIVNIMLDTWHRATAGLAGGVLVQYHRRKVFVEIRCPAKNI
jgi:hypothetical protein